METGKTIRHDDEYVEDNEFDQIREEGFHSLIISGNDHLSSNPSKLVSIPEGIDNDKYRDITERETTGVQETSETDQRLPKQKLEYFEWNKTIEDRCKAVIESQQEQLSDRVYDIHEENARKYWDIFYKRNTTNFYKNRNYIHREFNLDELVKELGEKKGRRLNLLEAGCGVGNTLFPLMEIYHDRVKMIGFDFSDNAIQMIQKDSRYRVEDIEVEVRDLVKHEVDYKQLDFVTLVFVLSGISPENHEMCIKKLLDCMDSNSYLYFRDYAEFDMAQLRLASRKDSKLKEGFYLKTDGTRVYYFNEKYLRELFSKFEGVEVEKLETHYRTIRNIKRGLEMNRVWIQGVIRKK